MQPVFDIMVSCNFAFVEVYFEMRVFVWVVLSVGQLFFFFCCFFFLFVDG